MSAEGDAKKRSDISIERLLSEMKSAKSLSGSAAMDLRDKIVEEFGAAVTDGQRSVLLAMLTAVLDQVERHLASQGDKAKALADFRAARAYEYKSLIYQECTVGLDTPVVGGDISLDMLMAVTNREIAAGRMTEDHSARKLAAEGVAAPHPSHAELLAKHAKLQAEAASAARSPPSKASVSYAFGAVLGKKFKGLFHRR
jgi:hypothetical protein